MRKYLEYVGYYLSCMFLVNLLYVTSIVQRCILQKYCASNIIYWFILSFLLTIIWFISTIFIVIKDDSKENIVSTGRIFKIVTIDNLNEKNYFINLYIIILVGVLAQIKSCTLMRLSYLLIEIIFGIIYIRDEMYYINPIYILLEYNIYRCTGKDAVTNDNFPGEYIFIVNRNPLEKNEIINYKNTSKKNSQVE